MSARQLNRLAKAKGLDHLLGGTLNEELDASEGTNDSEEDEPFSRGGVVSASVSLWEKIFITLIPSSLFRKRGAL